jgi:homoserine dehydrogenase
MSGSKELKVALAGLGTVGGGVVDLFEAQSDLLQQRAGRPIKLVACSALVKRDPMPKDAAFYTDARIMARDADYDVLVELIGGGDGIALEIVTTALERGKSVVTANKAMIAHHGLKLAQLAQEKGVSLGFEASVAGAIPIIKTLREGLAGNTVSRVMGILNGTCNYILTTMRDSGRDFLDVLAEAQALGYAEADPTFDIDGIDTAHKLSILAGLAFAMPVDIASVGCEGIRHVSALDIQFADELGYRIKLLGVAERGPNGVSANVYPTMVPLASPLAHVDGVMNAVVTESDFAGRTILGGRGAGARPTASAVVSDLVDLARGTEIPTFSVPIDKLQTYPQVPSEMRRTACYIRLTVTDEPGVLADIASALRDEKISMEQVLQRSRSPSETVPVVLILHETDEASLQRAIDRISNLPTVAERPHPIRIEAV